MARTFVIVVLYSLQIGLCNQLTAAADCPSVSKFILDASQPLQLLPGVHYHLVPGTFTLYTTVRLFFGQSLCVTGSSSARKPTIILPPVTPPLGTGNASRLHFAVSGGRLELHNVTLSGYNNSSARSPYVGGGGVVLSHPLGLTDGGTIVPLVKGSTLLAAKVHFEYITPRAVANVNDVKASMTFVDTTFQHNDFDGISCYVDVRCCPEYHWICTADIPSNDYYGCAGLTTVSDATFQGYTQFINNTWGALKSFPMSGDPPNITFTGPVLFERNSKALQSKSESDSGLQAAVAARSTRQSKLAGRSKEWPEQQAALHRQSIVKSSELDITDLSGGGIWAQTSHLVFKSTATFKDNRLGALRLISGSARFEGNAKFIGNQENLVAAVELYDASVAFMRDFTCKASGSQSEGDTTCGSGGCMSVSRSNITFEMAALFADNAQESTARGETDCAPSGGALFCASSNITFRGAATFRRNSANNDDPEGSTSEHGGGAWNLASCSVVAKQLVRFLNNTARRAPNWLFPIRAAGGAVYAHSSSLSFENGVELSGNRAQHAGGAMHLAAVQLTLGGQRVSCKNNYAGGPGSCINLLSSTVVDWDARAHPSCVQGNVVDELLLDLDDDGIVGGAGCIHITDSHVNFTGVVNFGSNVFHARGANDSTEMDLVVASSAAGVPSNFTCNGLRPRGTANYSIEGSLCWPACTGTSCTCPPRQQWFAGKCKCQFA